MNFKALTFVILLFSTKAFSQELTSEKQFQDYFITHKDSMDPIEGIWNVSSTQEFYSYDTLYDVQKHPKAAKVAILKREGKFETYNMTGESYNVVFSNTDVKGVYLYRNFFPETDQYSKTHAVISKEGEMEYTYDFPDEYLKIRFEKSYEEGTRVSNILKWTRLFPESPRKK